MTEPPMRTMLALLVVLMMPNSGTTPCVHGIRTSAAEDSPQPRAETHRTSTATSAQRRGTTETRAPTPPVDPIVPLLAIANHSSMARFAASAWGGARNAAVSVSEQERRAPPQHLDSGSMSPAPQRIRRARQMLSDRSGNLTIGERGALYAEIEMMSSLKMEIRFLEKTPRI